MKPWFAVFLAALPPLAWLAWSFGPGAQAWLLGVNLLTACLYAYDKTSAQRGSPRTPEAVLHLLALSGAVPAAAWARQAFRHKTLKASFDAALLVSVGLHWLFALTVAT